MPSRRSAITMTDAELHRFLQEERIVTVASMGPNGRPHLMPLWFVSDGAVISTWTFGKSQKVKNLERNPKATLQVEAGDQYLDLRGAMLECDVEIVRDTPAVEKVGTRIMRRYSDTEDDGTVPDSVKMQAPKRVLLVFRPTRVASWDHRKLGGGGY
jgi:PPOX class probable F420-dependent enzyme